MQRLTLPAIVLLSSAIGAFLPSSSREASGYEVLGLPAAPKEITSAYDKHSYDEVLRLSNVFLTEHADSPARFEVGYLAGRACWKLRRYALVEEFLTPLVTKAPGSPRWPASTLLLSRSLAKAHKYFDAAVWLSRLLARELDRKTRSEAEDLLEELGGRRLSPEEMTYIAYTFPQSSLRCWMVEKAAEEAGEGKSWEELWDLLGVATRECDPPRKWKSLRALAPEVIHHAPRGRCKNPFLVGLACPVEGPYADLGRSLKRGAEMALAEHNAGARFKLALVVRDTRGDPVRAVAAARGLAVEDGVVCVIGGLLSSTTIAAAGVTSALGTPLVSPSATREEIAGAGPNVFQTTLPRVTQARALAKVARGRLGAGRAGVLYPETADGRLLSDAFVEAFERAGGTVVVSSSYGEGETNFGAILSAASSKSPDCLMLAGSSRDMVPLVPQLSYYGLDIPVLATEAIASAGTAGLARKHLKRVLHSVGSYALKEDPGARFAEACMKAYGERPDEFVIKGYLAFRAVSCAMDAGARSRGDLADKLEDLVEKDPGLKGRRFIAVGNVADVEVPVLELEPER